MITGNMKLETGKICKFNFSWCEYSKDFAKCLIKRKHHFDIASEWREEWSRENSKNNLDKGYNLCYTRAS